MRTWNLREIEAPGGSRSPVVLESIENAARAVMIALEPGQDLGDHQVKEHAFLAVVEGTVQVEAEGESVEARPGMLFAFAPDERHAVSATEAARLLLVLAPWPGQGHYRGDEASGSA